MRGADLLARSLAAAGVTRIFSLSGNQIMPVYDGCIDAGIDIVHVRHESAAVFMADAWAQLTGETGIALVTAAPGFANAVGALYTAVGSESPLVLLSGDSPVGQDGRGAFQELDQTAVAGPIVKQAFRPATADALGATLAEAMRVAASGRPGPTHMALPFDVLQAETDSEAPPAAAFQPTPEQPGAGDVAKIAELLAGAERPMILTGPALNETRSGDLHARLATALDAPVLTIESPRGLNDPALGDVKHAFAEADLVLSLGKEIDFTLAFGGAPFADTCRWLCVSEEQATRDRAAANLGDRLALAVAADPKLAAETLVAGATPPNDGRAEWRDAVAGYVSARAAPAAGRGVTPAALTEKLQARLDRTSPNVLISDGGEFGQWVQAGLKGDARLINGPAGAIGGCLCYAVAAKLARPEATVFVLMGDGTAGFHFAEFETAARVGVDFVAIIGNDARWNAEHQIQLRDYGEDRLIGCELTPARYEAAAAGLGAFGVFIDDVEELDPAIDAALASGKPACINVAIDGQPAPSGSGH